MSTIRKILNGYDLIEKWFLIIMTAVMVIVIFAQVFTRYVMGNSLYWSEELGKFIFVWISWLGVSAGMKNNEHIQVRLVHQALDNKGLFKSREVLDLVKDLAWLFTSAFVAVKGVEIVLMQQNLGVYGASTGIPMWIPYLCIPLSGIIVCIRLVIDIIENVMALAGKAGKEEADG